jgi:hypothetical protein
VVISPFLYTWVYTRILSGQDDQQQQDDEYDDQDEDAICRLGLCEVRKRDCLVSNNSASRRYRSYLRLP